MSGCAAITGASGTPQAPKGSFTEREGALVLDLSKIAAPKADRGAVKLELERPEGEAVKVLVIRERASTYRA